MPLQASRLLISIGVEVSSLLLENFMSVRLPGINVVLEQIVDNATPYMVVISLLV